MTGVGKDLATLRDQSESMCLALIDLGDEQVHDAHAVICDISRRVEAELSRLREEERRLNGYIDQYIQDVERLREQRDAAQRESDIQMGEKLAAQMTLKAITDSLLLPLAQLGDGWTDSTMKILARIEEIVDESERGFRERDAAEARCAELERERDEARGDKVKLHDWGSYWKARCARLQQALAWYADENNWTQLASWGGRLYDDEAPGPRDCGKIAREALAGPDTLTAGEPGVAPDGTVRVAPADGCAERQSTGDPSPAASAGPDTPADSRYAHRLDNAQARAAEAAGEWCWNATTESEAALRDAVAEWRTALGLWRLSTAPADSQEDKT